MNKGDILFNQFLILKAPNLPTINIDNNDFVFFKDTTGNPTKQTVVINVNRPYTIFNLNYFLKKIDSLILFYITNIKKNISIKSTYDTYLLNIALQTGGWYEIVNSYIDLYNYLLYYVNRLNTEHLHDVLKFDTLSIIGEFKLNIKLCGSYQYIQQLKNKFIGSQSFTKSIYELNIKKINNDYWTDGNFTYTLSGYQTERGFFEIKKI